VQNLERRDACNRCADPNFAMWCMVGLRWWLRQPYLFTVHSRQREALYVGEVSLTLHSQQRGRERAAMPSDHWNDRREPQQDTSLHVIEGGL